MSVFIIAEIGINHNGDVGIAKQLIDMAQECGCDAVKFQKRTIDIVYTREALDTPRNSPWGTTTRQQKEGLEFGKRQFDEIDSYCRQKGIEWFASAWDIESQKFLRQYDFKNNKIASPMLTHVPLLKMVAEEKKHTFMSTGMSEYEEIDKAVTIFQNAGCPFTLLHCISTYPCADEECNVSLITKLKERYQCPVGYSGHETGVMPSVLAVCIGAVAVERHITLDRAMYGSDQSASLERRGLQILVRDCRHVDVILGNREKRKTEAERTNENKLRYYREE